METNRIERIIEGLKLINSKAEVILRREVMEADCLNFSELADKMSNHIKNICNQLIKEIKNGNK